MCRNIDTEIPLIVTKKTGIFLQMITYFKLEILFQKETLQQELLRRNILVLLAHIVYLYVVHCGKYSTTHLFYHRFRGKRFIKTLKGATKRKETTW